MTGAALRAAFRTQSEACASLGSPFMGRLMRLAAERLRPGNAVADRMLGWPGEVGPSGQSVPLRFAGALHGLVLSGADPGLAACYPPQDAGDDVLWSAVEAAMTRHEARMLGWLDSPPQTNEIRRSVALIYAAHLLRARFGLPLVLSELGASGGLNLNFDRYALEIGGHRLGAPESPVVLRPDWTGPLSPAGQEPHLHLGRKTPGESRQRRGQPPHAASIDVVDRAGVDLNPLDPSDPDGALKFLAYLWPDQPERLALTRAALALGPPLPDRGDAADWLARRLAARRPGCCHLVFHTVAWQYFPPETRAACAKHLAGAGRLANRDAPLVRLSMEADGTPGSAALTLETWCRNAHEPERVTLGRVDFHGRRAAISEDSVAFFCQA